MPFLLWLSINLSLHFFRDSNNIIVRVGITKMIIIFCYFSRSLILLLFLQSFWSWPFLILRVIWMGVPNHPLLNVTYLWLFNVFTSHYCARLCLQYYRIIWIWFRYKNKIQIRSRNCTGPAAEKNKVLNWVLNTQFYTCSFHWIEYISDQKSEGQFS